jgi:enediyne biosynthesis protein E4
MRRRTAFALVGVAVLLPACRREIAAGSFRFEAVPPETSGLDFREELQGGLLDNLTKSAMGGLALVDYDGDGRVDVYCTNGGWDDRLAGPSLKPERPAKCRLYRNLGGMRFEDVTEKAGVGFTGAAFGACVGDFDGDGHPDLFVPAYGMPALYRNRGDGTFEDVAERAGLTAGFYAGATFLDYDRDGVLDLFASQYVDMGDVDMALNRPGDFAPPGAYHAQPARLWRGRGDGTFEETTHKARVSTAGKGMGVLATDVDDDGWIDLFVANDGMPNFVWRNQGDGTFADAAARLGVAFGSDGDARASMGVTAADLDGDGRLDYLVPDSAGGCVYVAKDRHFTDRARDWAFAKMTFGFIGWADVAFDAENDGLLDVWKVHGDLRRLDGQTSKLVSNRGRAERGAVSFVYEPPAMGPEVDALRMAACAEAAMAGRGGVAADFDDDGREDLLALALMDQAHLFRNVTEHGGNWVRVRLAGKKPNTMAIGARLTAKCGGRPVVREISSSVGYISAPDVRQHIGLGTETSLDDVVVRWPSGKVQKVGTLEGNGDRVVTEE